MMITKLRFAILPTFLFASLFGLGCDKAEPSTSTEEATCESLAVCNFLEPGVSIQSCSDATLFCTGNLIGSAHDAWTNTAQDCLTILDCGVQTACLARLECTAVYQPETDLTGDDAGGLCIEDGMPCDFCWGFIGCEDSFIGGQDGCDCGCPQGYDPDCG